MEQELACPSAGEHKYTVIAFIGSEALAYWVKQSRRRQGNRQPFPLLAHIFLEKG